MVKLDFKLDSKSIKIRGVGVNFDKINGRFIALTLI